MQPYLISPARKGERRGDDVEPSGTRASPFADTIPDGRTLHGLFEPDDQEETLPSAQLLEAFDEEAPTLPGSMLRADDPPGADLSQNERAAEKQWDRVLEAVARAVRRVFTAHSI